VAGALALIAATVAVVTRDRGRIYPNIFIADQPMGGLSRAEAEQALARTAIPRPDSRVNVRVADATHRCRLNDIGVSLAVGGALDRAYDVGRTGPWLRRLRERAVCPWKRTDIVVPAVVDAGRVREFVADCARRFDHAPVNAAVEVNGREVCIQPGSPGVNVETLESAEAVETWAGGCCREELRLPVHFTGPVVTADRLKGVDTVLSCVETTLSGSSRDRRHNIALAAAAINGLILSPGAVFSYNQVVGPRTEETGYRKAPIIYRGTLVPGTGGGACQLSSTLYQAALLAGLEIVARSHHSHPVPYTPAGLDATVVYDSMDLKFRVTSEHPVALQARMRDRKLICRVLGHGPAPRIELVREVTWIHPPQPRVVEDPELAPGERVIEVEPRRGVRVRVVRRRATGAAGAADLVSTDHYSYRRGVIRQGVAPAAPEPAAEEAESPPVASGGQAPDGSAPATPTRAGEMKKERARMLTSGADCTIITPILAGLEAT